MMHISIRKYNTKSPSEVTKRVKDGFIPLIKNSPGFVSYYGTEAGGNTWASVSIFETKEGAEKSNSLAADWVKENAADLLKNPEVTSGDVIAHGGR